MEGSRCAGRSRVQAGMGQTFQKDEQDGRAGQAQVGEQWSVNEWKSGPGSSSRQVVQMMTSDVVQLWRCLVHSPARPETQNTTQGRVGEGERAEQNPNTMLIYALYNTCKQNSLTGWRMIST